MKFAELRNEPKKKPTPISAEIDGSCYFRLVGEPAFISRVWFSYSKNDKPINISFLASNVNTKTGEVNGKCPIEEAGGRMLDYAVFNAIQIDIDDFNEAFDEFHRKKSYFERIAAFLKNLFYSKKEKEIIRPITSISEDTPGLILTLHKGRFVEALQRAEVLYPGSMNNIENLVFDIKRKYDFPPGIIIQAVGYFPQTDEEKAMPIVNLVEYYDAMKEQSLKDFHKASHKLNAIRR